MEWKYPKTEDCYGFLDGMFERFDLGPIIARKGANYGKGKGPVPKLQPPVIENEELTDGNKNTVKNGDGWKCLCCGLSESKPQLGFSPMKTLPLPGKTVIDSHQTLCGACNSIKASIKKIDFTVTKTQLLKPKGFVYLKGEDTSLNDFIKTKAAIQRIVNVFYKCSAIHEIKMDKERNGPHYKSYEIALNHGNNPKWLLSHKGNLLLYIRTELGLEHVNNVEIK